MGTDFSYLKKADIKDFYVYNLSSLKWTQQSLITAVKWFPLDILIKKRSNAIFPRWHESSIVVSLGEDGIAMVWDFKDLSLHEKNLLK